MLTSCVLSYASSYELFEVSLNKYEFVDNRITDAIIKWVINNEHNDSFKGYFTIRSKKDNNNDIILEVKEHSGFLEYKYLSEYIGYIKVDSKPFYIERSSIKAFYRKALENEPLKIKCVGDGYICPTDGVKYWIFRVLPRQIQLRKARLLW
jgi:hypothetical protein